MITIQQSWVGRSDYYCFSNRFLNLHCKHNDANILVLGGRTVGPDVAKDMVDVFISTDFEGGRHIARLDKIHALESKLN